MKIVCIKNSRPISVELTLNKIYETIDNRNTEDNYITIYHLINDSGISKFYLKTYFITLAEWRDKQINEILWNG